MLHGTLTLLGESKNDYFESIGINSIWLSVVNAGFFAVTGKSSETGQNLVLNHQFWFITMLHEYIHTFHLNITGRE